MSNEDLSARVESLLEDARDALRGADDVPTLHQLKARYLGKQGRLNELMKLLRTAPREQKPVIGKAINRAKSALEALADENLARIEKAERAAALARTRADVTLPGRRPSGGGVHPLRRVERDILSIFREMGYSIAHGPDIETDFHNFEALNFPPDHPARDMQDTFLVEDGRLLRTHTSPIQVRTMLANEPPIRIAAPGCVYRCDSDVTHSPAFHQVEGLFVDRGVTMAHLKGTLESFVQRLYGPSTGIRLRPSFFPFTEPSAEVDVQCVFCGGEGCRVCGQTGWLEILGAGMVDPEVFRAVGIDPSEYTGFAFGIGIERVAMLRYGIDDIRLLFENDQRFLEQFA